MGLSLEQFEFLQYEERKKHIRDHRYYLGLDKQRRISLGEAVFSFFNDYLKADLSDSPEELIKSLDEGLYRHCSYCNGIFEGDFKMTSKKATLPENALNGKLGLILSFLNISSSFCNYCLEENIRIPKSLTNNCASIVVI